jgi:hypothetical protein
VNLPMLGIRMTLPPELSDQVLLFRTEPDQPGRVYFTTRILNETFSGCDALNHSIGVMTRVEGESSAMDHDDHEHGTAMFDFPGFHIAFLVPKASCVPLTTEDVELRGDSLLAETVAARQLWDAMLDAEPLT